MLIQKDVYHLRMLNNTALSTILGTRKIYTNIQSKYQQVLGTYSFRNTYKSYNRTISNHNSYSKNLDCFTVLGLGLFAIYFCFVSIIKYLA